MKVEWEPEAARALEKAPRIIRGLAQRKVEEFVTAQGRSRVTLADVEATRRKARPGRPGAAQTAGLDEADLRELEQQLAALENLPALQTRYYSIRVCGAAVGCPRARVEAVGLADRLQQVLNNSGLAEHLQSRIRGLILTHHKFRIALSGCPNACSQPQIVDFGVIGRVRPEQGPGACTQCQACVRICSEEAIEIVAGEPRIDRARCINCGDCVEVCPVEALAFGARGYSVLLGGRLGRHPRLAETAREFVSADAVVGALQACLELYFREAEGAEKFSALVERKGTDFLRSKG